MHHQVAVGGGALAGSRSLDTPTCRRWTRACVIPALWHVACQPQWGLSDCGGDLFVGVVVEEAALVDVSMWQAGLILGGGEGEGRIVGTDVAGNGFVIDGLAEDAASQRAVLGVP